MGLPNKILCETMMKAVLQQAQVNDALLSLSTCTGQPCGEAHIIFSSRCAAELCVKHFHGRQWDSSGTTVCARIATTRVAAAMGPEFEISGATLSAKAPTFVPASMKLVEMHSIGSDASTEVGESEAEDEKEWLMAAVAAER
jgi:hypothetical protein